MRSRIALLWTDLAQMHGRPLTENVLKLMLNAVADLPEERVIEVLEDWIANSTLSRHPFPAEIRQRIAPVPDENAVANQIVSLICDAIKTCGYNLGAEAKEKIGEVGWRVVRGFGGWYDLCCSDFIHNSASKAQAREMAKSFIVLAKAGQIDTPPALPEPLSKKQIENKPKELTSAKDALANLAIMKGKA